MAAKVDTALSQWVALSWARVVGFGLAGARQRLMLSIIE